MSLHSVQFIMCVIYLDFIFYYVLNALTLCLMLLITDRPLSNKFQTTIRSSSVYFGMHVVIVITIVISD